MRRAVLRMRGSTAGTDSRRLSRSVALSAKDLITGASYNVRASRLARRNSRGASARRLSRGRHCDRHAAPRRAPALSPPGLESAHPELAGALVFAVYAQTSRHAVMVKYEHANLVLWTAGAEPCLWSPARRTNPGIEPRARGPATGDPRLRALPASRHRTRIGHRARARCPNLLQRRPHTPRTADRTAESCGFISATRTPQRPLQQIWTTHRRPRPSTARQHPTHDPQRARTRPIPRTGFSRRVRNETAPATAPTTGRGGSAGGPAGRTGGPSEDHR